MKQFFNYQDTAHRDMIYRLAVAGNKESLFSYMYETGADLRCFFSDGLSLVSKLAAEGYDQALALVDPKNLYVAEALLGYACSGNWERINQIFRLFVRDGNIKNIPETYRYAVLEGLAFSGFQDFAKSAAFIGSYIILEPFQEIDFDIAVKHILPFAAMGGHQGIVEKIIRVGRGDVDLVKVAELCARGGKKPDYAFNLIENFTLDQTLRVATSAAQGGHQPLIERIVNDHRWSRDIDKISIAMVAAEEGYFDLTEVYMAKGLIGHSNPKTRTRMMAVLANAALKTRNFNYALSILWRGGDFLSLMKAALILGAQEADIILQEKYFLFVKHMFGEKGIDINKLFACLLDMEPLQSPLFFQVFHNEFVHVAALIQKRLMSMPTDSSNQSNERERLKQWFRYFLSSFPIKQESKLVVASLCTGAMSFQRMPLSNSTLSTNSSAPSDATLFSAN